MNLLFNIFLSGLLLIFVSFETDNDLNDIKKGALIYYGDNFYFIEDYCIMNKDDLSTFPADTCFQVKLLPIHEIKVNARKFKKIKLEGVSEKERSEEHTSELQSRPHLVCRLLLEKK